MSRDVAISPRAQRDIFRILRWLRKQSPIGAQTWYRAFWKASLKIAEDPERFSVADESSQLRRPVKHAIFKTRRGRRYRIIFDYSATSIYILRVRRPGQRPLQKRDLPNNPD